MVRPMRKVGSSFCTKQPETHPAPRGKDADEYETHQRAKCIGDDDGLEDARELGAEVGAQQSEQTEKYEKWDQVADGLHEELDHLVRLLNERADGGGTVAQDQQGDADGGAQKDDLQRVTVQERRDDIRGNDIQNDLIDGRESAQRRAARGQLQREKP